MTNKNESSNNFRKSQKVDIVENKNNSIKAKHDRTLTLKKDFWNKNDSTVKEISEPYILD